MKVGDQIRICGICHTLLTAINEERPCPAQRRGPHVPMIATCTHAPGESLLDRGPRPDEMLQVSQRALAIMLSGFDSAGDGGIDPLYQHEREEVEQEIGPIIRELLEKRMKEIRLEVEDKNGFTDGDPRFRGAGK